MSDVAGTVVRSAQWLWLLVQLAAWSLIFGAVVLFVALVTVGLSGIRSLRSRRRNLAFNMQGDKTDTGDLDS